MAQRIFLLVICLSICFSASSNNDWCGSKFSKEELEKIRKDIQESRKMVRKRGAIYYVPIKFHVIGDDNGIGYFNYSNILTALCELNERFEPVGIHFYMWQDVNYINNTAYSIGDDGPTMMKNNNVSKVFNMYFVPEQPDICGYYSFGSDAVVIVNGCGLPGKTTIVHELGHYFSLPHTFSGWEGYDPNGTDEPWNVEYVNGSNCTSAGDGFCDTPADFISDGWSCPYSFDRLDPKGDPYHPDSSFYMSYANDACQDRFSEEQIDAMLYNLTVYRTVLLNHADPDFFDMYQTFNTYPKDQQLNLPANYIVLKWNPVQGADGFNVLVTRFNGSKYNIDEITDKPYYVATNLQAGFKYRWKVKPFFYNNTCGDYSELTYFSTTDDVELSPDIRITNVSDCAGGDDGSINIDSITGGTAPYFYSWSNGKTTTNNNGLTAGIYTLTITDSDTLVSLVSIVEYEITEPGIGVKFDTTRTTSATASDGTVTAEALGTTDPISYKWSTGATSSSIESLSAGIYYITITDGNSCTVYDSVEVTATAPKPEGICTINNYIKSLTVYPNPLKETTPLNIVMNSNETTIGIIQIYGFNGQLVFEVSKELYNGENNFSINLKDIHSGLYFLKLQTESATYLQKFSFIK